MIQIAEKGWLPDRVIRLGIKRLVSGRRRDILDAPSEPGESENLLETLRTGPIALAVDRANEQHYEVPARFFERVLGPHLKYSACFWTATTTRLAHAERTMLELTCRRAGIENGMRVLDLGCGWGSLGLWIARAFPACRVTAVSNSEGQRRFIEARSRELGLDNVDAVTADMNTFAPRETFDRVVSVEMFEHMRNYRELLRRIASWLEPDGRLFVHVFCHRSRPYLFELDGRNDWMARHFFTGGLMPSHELLDSFDEDLIVERRWKVEGTHYERTALAWLDNLDAHRAECLDILTGVYGTALAPLWLQRWRMFFLACAELFAYDGGEEWFVSHSLLTRRNA